MTATVKWLWQPLCDYVMMWQREDESNTMEIIALTGKSYGGGEWLSDYISQCSDVLH